MPPMTPVVARNSEEQLEPTHRWKRELFVKTGMDQTRNYAFDVKKAGHNI
jgi:hypothetical protein